MAHQYFNICLCTLPYTSNIIYSLLFFVLNCRDGLFSFLNKKRRFHLLHHLLFHLLSIVREPPKLQYKVNKMLFSYVRRFSDLHDYNSKSWKLKKLTKIGLLQIVFHFFIFLSTQNYSCSK